MTKLLGFLSILSVSLTVVFRPCAAAPPLVTFQLEGDPQFANPEKMLQKFANETPRGTLNQFCLIGLDEHGEHVVWIIWKQRQTITLWEGQNLDEFSSRRVLNLKKDVVNSEDDLHGSSYLVTKEWVSEVESTCDRSGLMLNIVSKK